MGKGCKILHQDCDPILAKDRSLPYTAFLIEYIDNGETKYDIAVGAKQVDIFDDYWDKYRSCLLYTSPSPRDATLSRMPSSA